MEDKLLLDYLHSQVIYYINRVNEKNFDFVHLHYLNFSENFSFSIEDKASFFTKFENEINKLYQSYTIRFWPSESFDLIIYIQYIPKTVSSVFSDIHYIGNQMEIPIRDTFKPLYDSSDGQFRNPIEFPFGNIFE